MADGDQRVIEWHPSPEGGPLGRHVNHDPRSRNFQARRASARKSVLHRCYGTVLDQGNIGACTGFSTATLLNCVPTRTNGVIHGNADGLALYERATILDGYGGEYPPTDTGSDGLSAAKAAAERGWVRSYAWAFGLDHALDALVLAPITAGTDWAADFDKPDAAGRVHLAKGWEQRVRGGHQWCIRGIDVHGQTVRARNTWGQLFADHGEFTVSWADLGTLLEAQGDACTMAR